MDLNYLLHRQQVERTRAETAETREGREAHEALAREYERQIDELTGEAFRVAPAAGPDSSEAD